CSRSAAPRATPSTRRRRRRAQRRAGPRVGFDGSSAARRLRLQALGTPAPEHEAAVRAAFDAARIAHAGMEAARAFGPELDAIAPEPIPAPMRRPGHGPRCVVAREEIHAELAGLDRRPLLELAGIGQRLTLRAAPRVQLAA